VTKKRERAKENVYLITVSNTKQMNSKYTLSKHNPVTGKKGTEKS